MSKNRLPKDIIDKWPEVLNDVDVNVVPIEYLRQIEVTFEDDKTWVIDVNLADTENTEEILDDLEESLDDLFSEYEDVISGVSFVLDVEKVKRDITEQTRIFLKKKK